MKQLNAYVQATLNFFSSIRSSLLLQSKLIQNYLNFKCYKKKSVVISTLYPV